ncbi:MAG TPA: hypothetical protein VGQ96_01000, partial [Candidatus Eremiobacteraceae bacterium]|nr:hypothetical protein [Candidatus Eremiobacteraceae bacterium]
MSTETLVVFVRSAILAACIGAVVAYCSGAALRRGEGAAGAAVRVMLTLIVPATALALCGLFFWPVVLGASWLAAIRQGAGALPYLRDRLRAIWRAMSIVSRVACLTLIVALAFRAGAALSTPPTDGDSLLYHLPITAALIQDHSMWFTRALPYPAAAELGGAVGGAATGTVNGVVAFQFVQILALVLVGFGWARRAGSSVDGAAAAAVIAGSLPLVVDQVFTSQNDIFACATLAAACVLWRPSPRLAALSLGLLFAAKLTAFVLAPAVALVMVVFEGWPFSLADIAWAASLAAPWYLRTWLLTGNPAYTIPSLGWSSTIAANFPHAWRFVVAALRVYGGLASVAGIAAIAVLSFMRGRHSFARALPWLAFAAFASWIVLPNSAESVSGTLDQINHGWSLRYALLLPFVLATAVPIVLDRVAQLPLAAFTALVAAASAVVRSSNLTASNEPLGFVYGLLLLIAPALIVLAVFTAPNWSGRRPLTFGSLAMSCAIACFAPAAMSGAQSMRQLWNATYLQWSPLIPVSYVGLDKRIQASSKVAVVGIRSFPFVGPTFARRTYENIVVESPSSWLSKLRKSGVPLFVAAG